MKTIQTSNIIDGVYRLRRLRSERDLVRRELSGEEQQVLAVLEKQLMIVQDRRRQFRRIELKIPARVQCRSAWRATRIRNLSGGGMALDAVNGVERGEIVKILLGAGGRGYQFVGRVVWLSRDALGIAFMGLPETKIIPQTAAEDGVPKRILAAGTGPVRVVFDPPRARKTQPQVRSHPRHKVHVNVRYAVANEFVREYAENLSCGGLFVRGAHRLEKGTAVEVSLDLPGAGSIPVVAEVVHVVNAEQARASGGRPGAGLAIREMPAEFAVDLRAYLDRLGRRATSQVFTDSQRWGELLQETGYHVRFAAGHKRIVDEIANSSLPTVGVVVAQSDVENYKRALTAFRSSIAICAVDFSEQLDEVLEQLDQVALSLPPS